MLFWGEEVLSFLFGGFCFGGDKLILARGRQKFGDSFQIPSHLGELGMEACSILILLDFKEYQLESSINYFADEQSWEPRGCVGLVVGHAFLENLRSRCRTTYKFFPIFPLQRCKPAHSVKLGTKKRGPVSVCATTHGIVRQTAHAGLSLPPILAGLKSNIPYSSQLSALLPYFPIAYHANCAQR